MLLFFKTICRFLQFVIHLKLRVEGNWLLAYFLCVGSKANFLISDYFWLQGIIQTRQVTKFNHYQSQFEIAQFANINRKIIKWSNLLWSILRRVSIQIQNSRWGEFPVLLIIIIFNFFTENSKFDFRVTNFIWIKNLTHSKKKFPSNLYTFKLFDRSWTQATQIFEQLSNKIKFSVFEIKPMTKMSHTILIHPLFFIKS